MKKTKKVLIAALAICLVISNGMMAFAALPEDTNENPEQQRELQCTLEHAHDDSCYEKAATEPVEPETDPVINDEEKTTDQPVTDDNVTDNNVTDGESGSEPAEEGVFYVSANAGDDTAVKGSKENPYGSLAEAVKDINERTEKAATIVLLSDLTETSCSRINSKDVIIKGNGYTVTRGDNFATISDTARSWYNPAMIEVCDPSHSIHASLRLENITLTDGGKTEGTRYSQAGTTGTGGNGDCVQDGIIATYDGVATITLGQGTRLEGYGGMSAVRLSGGVLNMESGSLITGGKAFTTRGGGNGPAGGVWIQGGTFTMEQGSEISGIEGRAIYLDGNGSKAVVNGTISGVKPNNNMWQGTDGTAMHVRNESSAVLGSTGRITDINGGSTALSIISSSFTAEENSLISGLTNTRVANANGVKEEDKNPHILLLDGIIRDCGYGDVQFWAWYARYTVGPHGVIENTTASSKAIGMFYLQNGGELNVEGKIQNNNNTVVYMGNQGGAGTVVRVKDGAYIHGNQGYGVYANNSGHVEMSGGEISENNSYGIRVRCKSNWRDASLDMTGGKIINNKSYGILFETTAGSKSGYVNITGGEISGNGSSYSPYQISVSEAYSEDALSRLYIKDGIVKAGNGREAIINTSFGAVSSLNIGEGNEDFYIGNAKKDASDKLKELAKAYKTGKDDVNDYTVKGSALWFKAPGKELSFVAKRTYAINKALPLYVAYMPVKADGTPEADAKMTVKKVTNTEQVKIELKGLTPNQSYALMWLQPTEKFGSLLLEGKDTIHEVLGESQYQVDYTATYTLSKDIANLVEAGDVFDVEISLDQMLNYDESDEDAKVELKENNAFELATEPVYNSETHTLTVKLKVKADFAAEKGKSYSAKFDFKAVANFENFPKEGTLKTDGVVKGSLLLPGQITSTNFKVETGGPVTTALVPLPEYTITYNDGTSANQPNGKETVKEGVKLVTDLNGGSWNESDHVDLPETVTGDITLPDPIRSGYTFTGWKASYDKVTSTITFTAGWRVTYVPDPEGPTTPVDPPIIEDPDVPLNPGPGTDEPGSDDPVIDDPQVPLAPGVDLPQGEKPAKVENANQPKTGDSAQLLLLMGVLMLSTGALATVCLRKKED